MATREFDLDDSDKAALAELLRQVIAADRYPMSPRIRKLRAILDKLEPPAHRPEPFPAPKPIGWITDSRRRRSASTEFAVTPFSS